MLDYTVFPEQRQDLIKKIIQKEGKVICTELALKLNVSEHTIRRDLHELSKKGVCKKVYGGAVTLLPETTDYLERKTKKTEEKIIIAQKCAELIKPSSCIFIDTGTTNLALAEALPMDLVLTVVTNSPEIASVLLKKPLCNVILLGGQISKISGGCVGKIALEQLKGILFDQGFIGGCAMDPESGLTGFNYDDCEFKKAIISQCMKIVVALTADKIPAIARYIIANSSEIDVIVVKENSDKNYLSIFSEQDIRFYVV